MSKVEEEFLVLNLDNTLTWQERLLAHPHTLVDATQIEGKKSCATPQAMAEIESAMAPHPDLPLCFWGAGDYHYITYARLRTLRRPLTLVLFDHHHDCAPTQGGVITCGDWVRHAVELPWVQRVVWIGGVHPELWAFRPHPKLVWVRQTTPPARFAQWVARAVPTANIYLSVDKDVLAPTDAMTNWGAGDLPLSALQDWTKALLQHRTIIGADVGGEWSISASQVVPSLQEQRMIRQNEAANLKLLDVLAPALQRWQAGSAGRVG